MLYLFQRPLLRVSYLLGGTFIIVSLLSLDIWNVTQMKWNWVDSHWIINQAKSHPDFWTYNTHESMGRDRSGYSLFYQVSHMIYGVDSEYGAQFQYAINYAIHALTIIGAAFVLIQHISSRLKVLFYTVFIMVQSSGPEVYLNQTKNEHFGTLWFVLTCILFTNGYHSRQYTSLLRKYLLHITILTCTALSIGFLGKETFIFFIIAFVIGRFLIPIATKSTIFSLTPVDSYILTMIAGTLVYFAYRTITGVKLPLQGSYSSALVSSLSFFDRIFTFQVFFVHSLDLLLIVCLANLFLLYIYLAHTSTPDFDLSSLYIFHVCALGSALFVIFHVVFIRYPGTYYLYPPAVMSIIATAIGFESQGFSVSSRSRLARTLITTFLTVLLFFTFSRWLSRSSAMVSVTRSVERILSLISRLPEHSRILIDPLRPADERIGSLHIIMTYIYHRNDIVFESIEHLGPVTQCDHVWLLTTGTSPTAPRFGFGVRDLNGWSDTKRTTDVTLISTDHNWLLSKLDVASYRETVPLYLFPVWQLQPSALATRRTTLLAESITLEWDLYQIQPDPTNGFINCSNAN